MKTFSLVLGTAFLLAAGLALAADRDDLPHFKTSCCDAPVEWADRMDPQDARLAITTRDGNSTLMLTDRIVATQFSDRLVHRLDRKFHAEKNEDDSGPLGQAIKSAVFAGVRSLIDHSAQCPVRDITNVEYKNGRLLFWSHGDSLFQNIQVDQHNVMESFTESDAKKFIREFWKVKKSRN